MDQVPAVSPTPTPASHNPIAAQFASTHQPELPRIPDVWPGAWKLYSYSKEAVKLNWGLLLGLWIINIFASLVLRALLGGVIGELLAWVIEVVVSIGIIMVCLEGVRGQKVPFDNMIKRVTPMLFLKYFAGMLLLGLALVIAAILFIVPFIIILPRVILAPYFLIDMDMGPAEAISASWKATKDHTGKVWGIIGASIALGLLAITIIGIPFSLYFLFMYGAAYAVLYNFISRTQPAVTPVPTPLSAHSHQ